MKKKKNKLRKNSIQFRIIGAVLIIFFITVSALTGISVYTIDKKMMNQMEQDGMALAKQIASQLESSNLALEQMEIMLEDKLKTAYQLIGERKVLSNEELMEVAEKTGISEIDVTDKNGVIIYSNLLENIGWVYPGDHAVAPLLKGEKTEVIEAIRKSAVSENYYKYGATALEDGGIIQVGILANKIEELKSFVEPQKIVEEITKKDTIVFACVIGKDMKVKAHSEKQRVGSIITDEGSKSAAVNGKMYSSKYSYKGQEVYDILMPLYNNGEHVGAVDIGISMKNVESALKQVIIQSIIISLLSLVLGGMIIIILVGRIIKPLNRVVEVANKVSGGDLTENISIKSNDEIGIVANSFNVMIENLRNITGKIQDVALNVSSYSQEILSSAQQASSVSEQIATSTQDVAQGAQDQVSATSKVSSNIKDMASSMEKVKNEVNQVVDNAEDTSKLALEGRTKMENMIDQINTIKNSVHDSSYVMMELEKTSDEIGNIVGVINDIANQTNLLALNAAIEAARAGEMGKGFAVVADEIRKLAEQSMKSANNISDLIEKTQGSTKKALISIEDGSKEAEKGEIVVKEVGNSLKEILDGFDVTKNKLDEVNKNILESTKNAENVMDFVQEIEEISEQSAANTEEVAASSEEQSATIEEMTRSVEKLANMARNLEDIVKMFKLN